MRPRSFMWSRTVDPSVLEQGWEGVRARRERSRGRARRRMLLATGLLVPLAALLLFLFSPFGRAPTTSADTTTHPLALADGSPLPREFTAHRVALDDGSNLELAERTLLRTKESSPSRVELALDIGKTTFDVKPGGPRMWIIEAGSVTVRVLGTRFSVGRDSTGVHVSVERGKVLVQASSLANGSRVLVAGESVDVPSSPPPPTVAQPVADVVTSVGDLPPAAPSRVDPPASRTIEAPLVTPPVVTGRPKDSMTDADTARREGRPKDAVALLTSMVDAHDTRASLAAFTIGKIHAEDLGDFRNASVWFERAFALGLPAGLDEQALARAVECHARSGARSEASAAAARYESRFPQGPHLESVRSWARD